MGYAATYLNLVFIFLTLFLVIGLMQSFADYHETKKDLTLLRGNIYSLRNTDFTQTDFNYTNQSQADWIRLYLRNTGSLAHTTSDFDLYLDDEWISHASFELEILNTTFDPSLWNPSEILEVRTQKDLSVGTHKARITTPNAVALTHLFNASRCPDGICTGGEYCLQDNAACPDNTCYNPLCEDGCTQEPIVNAQDEGECDSTGLGCETDSCICSSESTCCGAVGSTCTQNTDCCSNSCNLGVGECTA
ncbi:MAG: hypothetical protein GF334_02785 [Candidatus Altiarchaeales archaeon]|nr:hypothetical protein [Candidatus Altiarchaeales archaeon]